jgi:putative restriction endonuclease
MTSNPMRTLNRSDILAAIEKGSDYSIEGLREQVGGNRSIKFLLVYKGHEYEAKVIIQLAWNLRHPENPISAADFRGDVKTVAAPLRAMGFDVVELASSRHFGHVPHIPVGTVFANRVEASIAGVHRPRQAGISGAGDGGADSIVVSGGYIDDEDFGSRIIYTGHGGNDPASRRQVADQELERGNLALAVSCDQQIPVRVLRGAGGDPAFSPTSGFRYDGLFKVVRYWPENGVDGFRIWRFELQQLDDSPFVISVPPIGNDLPERRPTAPRNQIVRDPRLSDWVKRLHNWTCQFCGDRLATPAGAYAEAAHIRPLGTPHNGPDQTSNLLCLCPNCHKRFDTFARFVDENGQIVDTTTANVCGHLRTHSEHHIEESNFDYHRRQARML